MVESLVDEQQAYLAERLGATRFTRPQLPVIPLGVECAKFAPDPAARAAQRAALGVTADDGFWLDPPREEDLDDFWRGRPCQATAQDPILV